MNTKDAMIIAQVAAKVAGNIHAGTGDTTGYAATVDLVQNDLLLRAARGVTEATPPTPVPAAITPAVATANVVEAFPQAQVAPIAPQPAVAPLAATPLPFPSTGNDNDDKMYADLIANPDNWWNNINDGGTTYTGGIKPDFRHKTAVNAKGDKLAIWLVSRKYGRVAPDLVFTTLGLQNPGAVQPVPPATAAVPVAPVPADAPF